MNRLKIAFLLLLAACFSHHVTAQHHIGVRLGTGGGLARFDTYPRQEMRLLLGYYPSAGISWKYYGRELGVSGIQVDLQYVTKGFRELRDLDLTITEQDVYRTEYVRKIQMIELPVFWQAYFYAFKRRLRVYFNAGAFASYMLSSQEYTGPYGSDPVWTDYEIRSVRDNVFGYGLAGGAGFSVLFGRFEFFAEGRYAFGFSDLMKSGAKYPGNASYTSSQLDMINISAGFYLRLGKGGILAPLPGTNRSTESWDSIPVGRNREHSSSGSSGGNQPIGPNR